MTSSEQLDGAAARVVRWITEHGGAVRGYLTGLLRDKELAEDLTQEVFRRAWEARDRYEELGLPRAYLWRIADRLVCDHLRRSRRETTVDDSIWSGWEQADPAVEPGETLIQAEARAALAAALDTLTEPQRRVLLLRYYGELAFEEIASVLDCPLNTALSHCRRGLLTLRQLMTGHEQK